MNLFHAENYTPPPALVYQSQWYHGTLDRSESNQILRKYAKNMIENRKSELSTAAAASDDENGNANGSENDLLSSGTFLVRFSKKENNLVLTLLDNDQLKNFIIRKHVSHTPHSKIRIVAWQPSHSSLVMYCW